MAKKFKSGSMGGMRGGMGNINNMMKQVQKMQKDMEKAQAELEAKTYEATAGGGAVAVTMNGKKELTSLTLDKDVVDPDDIDMLQDLILVAVNDAIKQVEDEANQKMGQMTGGMNIPGLF